MVLLNAVSLSTHSLLKVRRAFNFSGSSKAAGRATNRARVERCRYLALQTPFQAIVRGTG